MTTRAPLAPLDISPQTGRLKRDRDTDHGPCADQKSSKPKTDSGNKALDDGSTGQAAESHLNDRSQFQKTGAHEASDAGPSSSHSDIRVRVRSRDHSPTPSRSRPSLLARRSNRSIPSHVHGDVPSDPVPASSRPFPLSNSIHTDGRANRRIGNASDGAQENRAERHGMDAAYPAEIGVTCRSAGASPSASNRTQSPLSSPRFSPRRSALRRGGTGQIAPLSPLRPAKARSNTTPAASTNLPYSPVGRTSNDRLAKLSTEWTIYQDPPDCEASQLQSTPMALAELRPPQHDTQALVNDENCCPVHLTS